MLLLLLVFALVLHFLLGLLLLHMRTLRPCMLHLIHEPVVMVPRGKEGGSRRRFAPVSEVEAGVNVRRPAVCGGRLQVTFLVGNQALVAGGLRGVWSHFPSTRRFQMLQSS